jgi:ankyrin repeat protein
MSDALPLPLHPEIGEYKKLAKEFQEACRSKDPDVIRQWFASLARQTPERIEQRWRKFQENDEQAARCALSAVQFFIAREHGFASWPRFARHVQEMARADSPVAAFETAADAIVSGNAQGLRKLLDTHPGLTRKRSTREHRSTLLHYVSANGVEDFRQKTPNNIVELTNLLLDAGADVHATSDAYGGGCSTLLLVATSIHPERAEVQIPLLQTLLDRGATFASPRAHAARGSIVNECLANGQINAARFFADLGAPLDLEGAAALGRLDVLRTFFAPERQKPDQQELESAFLYACGCGSRAAAEFLLERGVDLAARNSDGQTALHWANYGAHLDVIKLLLERGAAVNGKDDRFHAAPIDMALWTWQNSAQKDARDRCYEAIALLVRAGAKLDPDHWKNPGEDGSLMLEKIDSDTRMKAALRGETP